MRISDWSSDFGSSDLVFLPIRSSTRFSPRIVTESASEQAMRVVGPSVMTVSCNSSMEISSHICEKINARVHLFDRPKDAGRGQDMTDVLEERELTVSGMIRHHATVAQMAPAVGLRGRAMTYPELERIANSRDA